MKPKSQGRPLAAAWLLGLEFVLEYITAPIHFSRNVIMTTFNEMPLDCINCRQETTNGGIPAGSGDRSDRWRGIVYAVTRAIKVHERRDYASEAIEQSWDEDTAEKPDIVMFETPPEVTQSGRANATAGEADGKSV